MQKINNNKWLKKRNSYNKAADNRNVGVFAFENLINTPSLIKMLPKSSHSTLDLGVGTGEFTKVLVNKYSTVVAHEISNSALLKHKFNKNKVFFTSFDLEKKFPNFESGFDLIVAKLVLMYITNLSNLAKECYKSLSNGGVLIISVTHPLLWHTRYLEDKFKINLNKNYRNMKSGYFSQVSIQKRIGDVKGLEFNFIHRTISSYINTFTEQGFNLVQVCEPKINTNFLKKFPNFTHRRDVPLRLNLKFVKVSHR